MLNLKQSCKEYINENLFLYAHSNDNWRVLIDDNYTIKILSPLYTTSQILSYNIISIENINKEVINLSTKPFTS